MATYSSTLHRRVRVAALALLVAAPSCDAKVSGPGPVVPPVDVTGPTVAIIAPAEGAAVSGTVAVRGTAADDVGVVGVDVQVDGGAWNAATGTTTWSFAWAAEGAVAGAHQLAVRARDAAGNVGTAAAQVTVAPPPPVAATPQWPFDRPTLAELHRSPRKVFAHWHWYPISLDNASGATDYYARGYLAPAGERNSPHLAYGGLMRERPIAHLPRAGTKEAALEEDAAEDIALARELGVDGFLLNLWDASPGSNPYPFWTALVAAAQRYDDFSLVPNFDTSIMADLSDEALLAVISDWMDRLNAAGVLHRVEDGRVAIGFYYFDVGGTGMRSPAFFTGLRAALASAFPEGLYLVFVLHGSGNDSRYDPIFADYAGVADLYAGWGTAVPQTLTTAQSAWTRAQQVGKPWMPPVVAQDYRPKAGEYREAAGSAAERTSWESAIASSARWAQIVTWNDHAEHHALRPATGKQWAAYDLAAYYVTWWKTGARPPIVRDAVYYFHRVHAVAVVPTDQTKLATCKAGCPGADALEALTFLTAPGTVEISVDGVVVKQQDVGAGVSSVTAPLSPGRARLRVLRDGVEVAAVTSAFQVRGAVSRQDLLYRSGGSLRASLGQDCAVPCQAGDAAACLACVAEPVWLAADP